MPRETGIFYEAATQVTDRILHSCNLADSFVKATVFNFTKN